MMWFELNMTVLCPIR